VKIHSWASCLARRLAQQVALVCGGLKIVSPGNLFLCSISNAGCRPITWRISWLSSCYTHCTWKAFTEKNFNYLEFKISLYLPSRLAFVLKSCGVAWKPFMHASVQNCHFFVSYWDESMTKGGQRCSCTTLHPKTFKASVYLYIIDLRVRYWANIIASTRQQGTFIKLLELNWMARWLFINVLVMCRKVSRQVAILYAKIKLYNTFTLFLMMICGL
jgi:hypothetical protein